MKASRRFAQAGFTLIELIIVIVIIGILAAVAIPKFQDLSSDAQLGVARGVAAAGASASSVRYAQYKGGTKTEYKDCTDIAADVDMPTGYTFKAGALILKTDTANLGKTTACEVLFNAASFSTPVTFNAYGA